MAFVQQTTLIKLRYRDNDAAESSCQINYAPSVPIDTLIPLVASWRALIGAISSAVCVNADIVIRFAETGAITAGNNSNNRRSGCFTYETAAMLFYAFRVPSIGEQFICIDGSFPGMEIDDSITDVQLFNAHMVTGSSGIQPCDIDGSDLTAFSSAFVEQF